jgi:hypothetical protein
MNKELRAQIERTLRDASIASVRSWVRAQGKRLGARTREKMIDRVTALIEKSELTLKDLDEAIVGIEEAGGKLIFLFEFQEACSASAVKARIAKMGISLSSARILAKPIRSGSAVTYALLDGDRLRIKWTEIHRKPKMDLEADTVVYDDVKKVIVLTADLKRKLVEIRYDRPETLHPHSSGAGSKEAYFNYYRKLVEDALGVKLSASELQKALKRLIEMSPTPVRLHRGGHTNTRNNYFSGIVRGVGKDIREDDEYKAMYAKGGKAWAYEDQSFYWRPDQSRGKLNREVFSHVNTFDSSVRVDADCWDAEVDYAVEYFRQLQ